MLWQLDGHVEVLIDCVSLVRILKFDRRHWLSHAATMVCILDLFGLIVALDVSLERLLCCNSSHLLSDLLQKGLWLILERFEARLKLI